MDDTKRVYRDTEEKAKEAWRKHDGEDLADKVGNLGDDIREGLGNAGDALRRGAEHVTDRARGTERSIDNSDVDVPSDPPRPI